MAISAINIYVTRIPHKISINSIGRASSPNNLPRGVQGRAKVRIAMSRVVPKRYFPGTLLKKGFLVRITSTIREADNTDSRNQPVLN